METVEIIVFAAAMFFMGYTTANLVTIFKEMRQLKEQRKVSDIVDAVITKIDETNKGKSL